MDECSASADASGAIPYVHDESWGWESLWTTIAGTFTCSYYLQVYAEGSISEINGSGAQGGGGASAMGDTPGGGEGISACVTIQAGQGPTSGSDDGGFSSGFQRDWVCDCLEMEGVITSCAAGATSSVQAGTSDTAHGYAYAFASASM